MFQMYYCINGRYSNVLHDNNGNYYFTVNGKMSWCYNKFHIQNIN